MTVKDFLLTYSVSPRSHRYDSDAEKIRQHIRNFEFLSNWDRIENLETVLKGTLDIVGSNISERRDDAKDQVYEFFRNVFNEDNLSTNVYSEIDIYVALLVDGLGESIELRI